MQSLDDVFRGAEAAADELLQTLRDLIRIPTVNTGSMPTGHELAACDYVKRKLAADGVEAVILPSATDRANLAARWPAGGPSPRSLLVSHTDVVLVATNESYGPGEPEVRSALLGCWQHRSGSGDQSNHEHDLIGCVRPHEESQDCWGQSPIQADLAPNPWVFASAD